MDLVSRASVVHEVSVEMPQQYQNVPAQGYGAAYGSAYYPPQSPYTQRPTYTPPSLPQHNAQPPAAFHNASNPSMNLAFYEANGQVPPAQTFPFPAASFPPEMLQQFANGSFPPPPPPSFPPVPLPNLNFPQFPQAPNPTGQSANQYSQPPVVSDDDADAYDPRFPRNILQSLRPGNAPLPALAQSSEAARKEPQRHANVLSHAVSHGEHQIEQPQAHGRGYFPSNLDSEFFLTASHA